MSTTPLIEPAELKLRLGASDLVVVDCRFDLLAPEAGADAYARAHVPDAIYGHLDRDLAGPITSATGRHPLPAVDVFEATLRRWGVGQHSQVIAYDDSNGLVAARFWWMLRWLGAARIAVLNGGWQQWVAQTGLQSTAVPTPAAGDFRARADRAQWVSTEEIVALVCRPDSTPTSVLIDARSAERFAGVSEPIDPIAGHVPGAINHPLTLNLDAAGRFLPAAELRSRWQRTLGPHSPTEAIAMCGSGVSACHNLLALDIAGLGGARLYPGSWSEWIRDRGHPIATTPTDAFTCP
jgi:thiosulfate/3-mercaptopyruvate sulfurtransferase